MKRGLAPVVLLQLLIGIAFGSWPVVGKASSEVLTFQAWKTTRLEEARNTIERLQLEAALDRLPPVDRSPGEKTVVVKSTTDAAPASSRSGVRVLRPEQRLNQAKINFEIAKELSIHDYIAVYLSQYSSRASMLEVAKKMSPDEVAELLLALRGVQTPTVPIEPSATSASPKR
ncbi:MAG: hypothetical protein JNJ49_09890 [Bdellovibrionaceae bacterium]|nr:hypothetical protein [Pseudobdellovibrionaceae bacterium]